MKFFVFLFAFALNASLCLADQVFPMPQSISPDGRYSMVFLSHILGQETGESQGQIAIKNQKTGKVTVFVDDTDFLRNGDYAADVDVVWSPNGRFVAMAWARTRGYIGCSLFMLDEGKLKPVKLPDYGKEILKQSRENKNLVVNDDMGGKGWEYPLRWISNDELLLDVGNNAISPLVGDVIQEFHVTIRIAKSKDHRNPITKIQHIEILSLKQMEEILRKQNS